MKKLFIIMLFFTIAMQSQTVMYTESFENFANPERGFYHQIASRGSGDAIGTYIPLNLTDLNNYRVNEKITLISRIFWLDEFINSQVSDAYITKMKADFVTLRSAGVKCIIRFKYTNNETIPIEPTPAIIKLHINKLKLTTSTNQDVISSIEAGFIGAYGEWTKSTISSPTSYSYGNGGGGATLSYQNKKDRKEIGLKIMELAPSRMVSFRTPYFQQLLTGIDNGIDDITPNLTPISANNAYNGSILSRIAAHNDCFLRDNTDAGTFTGNQTNQDAQRSYLSGQSIYTFDGGETCKLFENNSPLIPISYLLPDNARIRMKEYHFSYLSADWFPQVVASGAYWDQQLGNPSANGSFLEEIKRRLGYRFVLNTTNIANNTLTININNTGYANLFNSRKVILIFKNSSNQQYSYELTSPQYPDVRFWDNSSPINFSVNLLSIGLPLGTYNIFIKIPDIAAKNSAINSIRFANKYQGNDIWDANTGYNNLYSTITITPTTASRIKVKDDTLFFDANAYPNPFSDSFKLDISTSSEEVVTIKVYDMIGKLIENKTITNLELGDLQVGNGYKTGVYNIVVTQGENIKSMRVVKN